MKMNFIHTFSGLVIICAGCLTACRPAPVAVSVAAPEAVAETITPARVVKDESAPDVLKIKLTLGRRQDLRVREGQHISAGGVLCDRSGERQRLTAQRDLLQLSMKQIAATMPRESAPVELPAEDFAEAKARISSAEVAEAKARAGVARQKRAVEEQKKVVLAVAKLETLPAVAQQHEAARLAQREADATAAEQEAAQAHAAVDVARAQLASEKTRRAFIERERAEAARLEAARLAERRQTAEIQKAEIISRLATLDFELHKLSVVRAPFSGAIQRIVWEGATNNEMQVTVWLSVGESVAGSERGGTSPG